MPGKCSPRACARDNNPAALARIIGQQLQRRPRMDLALERKQSAHFLAASAAIGQQFELIAAVDLLSAVLLIGGGHREIAVAVLFLCMAGATTIASRLHLPPWAVSSGLEFMTALQCGVIGGADRGMGYLGRSVCGYWAGVLPAMFSRPNRASMARNRTADRGEVNGR